jgi:hypothetical protein
MEMASSGQLTDYYYDDRLVETNNGTDCASKCVSYDYDGRGTCSTVFVVAGGGRSFP